MAMATSSDLFAAAVRFFRSSVPASMRVAANNSSFDDGEHLSFGDNVINVDEYRFEFARCG
jgi:hypothetical protein